MTDTPAPGDGNRWRGYAHKDLYVMLHDGPGAAASAEPSRRWAEISATLTEIGQDLQKALDLTGTAWRGKAAGNAYNRLSTTVAWATASGTNAAAMRTGVEDQADHIARARADMPKPEDVPATQPDPTAAAAVQVVQAQTDAEPAEAAATSAEERAVEVMTAYETNTNGTTAALAPFDKPERLLPNTGMHQGQGGGLLGLGLTGVASALGGRNRQDDRRHDDRGRGGGGGHGSTSGQSSPWNDTRRRSGAPVPGPGRMSGASADPFFGGPGANGGRSDEQPARGRSTAGVSGSGGSGSGGSGGSGGGGGAPGAGPKSGLAGMPAHELQQAQQAQQAAAASQAAAGAHPGAGAPLAPTAGTAGAQEKMALRRLGMEAIGSSQWFGDTEEPVAGQSPKRRFDLRDSADDTESSSILDEENQLPPNVIGEGGR